MTPAAAGAFGSTSTPPLLTAATEDTNAAGELGTQRVPKRPSKAKWLGRRRPEPDLEHLHYRVERLLRQRKNSDDR